MAKKSIKRRKKLIQQRELSSDEYCSSDSSSSLSNPSHTRSRPRHVERFSFWWFFSRWPLLIIIGVSILFDLLLYYIVRQGVVIYERFFFWVGVRYLLRQRMFEASTYEEWVSAAKVLDDSFGSRDSLNEPASPHYDEALIAKIVKKLQRKRDMIIKLEQSGNLNEASNMMNEFHKVLIHYIHKNIGGIESEALYSHTYYYAKKVVESYVNQIMKSLDFISESCLLTVDEKTIIMKKASRSYGRSALCLSGGGSFGYYHLGVVKALMDTKTLPQVITGTSAGSLIAAVICVRTDEEIYREVLTVDFHKRCTACEAPLSERWANFKRSGSLFNNEEWYRKTVELLKGPITFLEAFQWTGKILNISVVPDEPYANAAKQLNYITTPDIIIASAVIASSAVPGILAPQTLLQKDANGRIFAFRGAGRRWRDGSLNSDIPERELHLLFDVNYTIVSSID